MRIRLAVPEAHVSPDVVDAALESVTRLDQQEIAAGQVPPFDPGLVKWKPEPAGDEHFDDALQVVARGYGDCDDLAPWRAASLRTTGEDPGATAHVIPSGPNTYHAIVQRSDGTIDDPSIAAGMKPLTSRPTTVVGGTAPYAYPQMLPTTGPLSAEARPTYAVRRAVIGGFPLWQARVDVPIVGSRLVHVHSYNRHYPRHHRCRTHGAAPYSLVNLATAADPHTALQHAVIGALCLGACGGRCCAADQARLRSFLPGAAA